MQPFGNHGPLMLSLVPTMVVLSLSFRYLLRPITDACECVQCIVPTYPDCLVGIHSVRCMGHIDSNKDICKLPVALLHTYYIYYFPTSGNPNRHTVLYQLMDVDNIVTTQCTQWDDIITSLCTKCTGSLYSLIALYLSYIGHCTALQ